MPPMPGDAVIAVRAEFSIEDPWRSPVEALPVRLRLSGDGGAPHLSTTVALYFDNDYLSLIFSASDDHVVATYSAHDDPLYDEDGVEVCRGGVRLQRSERAVAQVEDDPGAQAVDAGLDEVARRGGVRSGKRARAADDGDGERRGHLLTSP